MATIQVYPLLSPRIIEVLDPATEITVQEIVDLIRDWEDDEAHAAYDFLIDAAGKEPLGGGVVVGITATLQNAQIRFTARVDELTTGTVTTNDSGGQTLYDSGASFESDSIYSGCTVVNDTTTAMETVIEVVSDTEIEHFALGGGTRNDWQIGDSYSVYPNVQCAITGGNLVAVDDVGDEISPVLQSPNVQIVRSSSSSATLQELGAIQYASYNGGVTIDESSSYSGITFPVGTPQEPVNNLAEAMLIATERGFTTLYIIGDMIIDAGGDYSNMTFIGESMSKSTLTISSGADVENCEFYEATVDGTLDGNAKLRNCRLLNLDYIYGVVEQCMIGPGTIVLGGTQEAHFLDCWSGVAGVGTPVIDCGGSGQDLGIRNYNGGIKLINKTGTDKVSIDLNSGQVVLDSTVTNGEIVVRGIGKLTDNSTGSANIVDEHLLRTENITDAIWDEALADHLTAGTTGKKLYDGGTGDPAEIAAAVWDADKDDYNDPDTMGELQNTGGTGGGLTAEETAAAVWDAVRTLYGTPGTFGATDEWAGEVDESAIADAVWSKDLPGSYASGEAGEILGDNLDQSLSVTEENIRGSSGTPTLVSISEQLDTVQTDLDNPDQYKVSTSEIANAVWDATPGSHNSPETMGRLQNEIDDLATEANATSNRQTIVNQVQENENKIDVIDVVVDAIKERTDKILDDPASETNATANKVAIITAVDDNEAKIDIIDTVVDAIKLSTNNLPGDPMSISAATANKNAIIAQVNANETKIDSLPSAADIETYLAGIHGDGSWETGGTPAGIAAAVWNALLADYNIVGTMGRNANLIDNVPDNVDNKLTNEHGAGSWTPDSTTLGSISSDVSDIKANVDMKLSELQTVLQGADTNTLESIANVLDNIIGSVISQPRIIPGE